MHRWLATSLAVYALAAANLSAAESKPQGQARPGEGSHMLNLALIVAGKEVKEGMQPVPPPVAKAIQDIKGFLPYTNYELQDTAVVRGVNMTPIHFNLVGPTSRYQAALQYQLTEDPKKLNVFKFDLVRTYEQRAGSSAQNFWEQPAPDSYREVLSTAFLVNVGEPIVVGTSRLDGTGTALVVILTVMPAGT